MTVAVVVIGLVVIGQVAVSALLLQRVRRLEARR